MTEDWYETMRAPYDAAARPLDPHELASRGQRFLNLLIDQTGLYGLSLFIGVGSGVTGSPGLLQVNDVLFGLLVALLYYVPSEVLFGVTLGKLVTGTRVVTETGETPSLNQVLGRTLTRFVPFEIFSFLGGKGRPVGWHDSWSSTRVVPARSQLR